MGMSAAQYLSQAKALLPRGKLWQSLARIGSTFSDLLDGISQEFARIDADAEALLDEMDPLTVTDTIDAWERFYQLPDGCGDAPTTIDARRDALLARAVPSGKLNRQWMVDQAAVMGFTITINNLPTPYHFEVLAPEVDPGMLSVGEGPGHQVGEAIRAAGPADQLECMIIKSLCAGTRPTFVYRADGSYSLTYTKEMMYG